MKSFLYTALEYALDTVAPPDPRVRAIERMTPAEFSLKASQTKRRKEIEGVISLFPYTDPLVKSAILEIKSYGSKKMAEAVAEAAYELLIMELSELEIFQNFTQPILVPIPLTKKSLRKRGWNQCELVAREIARIDDGKTLELRTDLLVKSKETEDQVGKTRTERFANLKDCFKAPNPEAIRDRNVIVLDDVVTTGATLGEAKRTLIKAGARKVILVALSH